MITRQDVEHVARLARLALTEEEKDKYASQLSSILGYIETLNKPNTDNVPVTTHALPLSNVWRDDKPEFQTLATQEELLTISPEREGPFYKVKKVIE